MGLQDFVYQDAPTYRRLTMQLLTTLRHTVIKYPGSTEEGIDRITFQLMNRKYNMSLNEWCDHFGFFNGDAYVRCADRGLNPSPQTYFNQMSIYQNIH